MIIFIWSKLTNVCVLTRNMLKICGKGVVIVFFGVNPTFLQILKRFPFLKNKQLKYLKYCGKCIALAYPGFYSFLRYENWVNVDNIVFSVLIFVNILTYYKTIILNSDLELKSSNGGHLLNLDCFVNTENRSLYYWWNIFLLDVLLQDNSPNHSINKVKTNNNSFNRTRKPRFCLTA